MDSFIFQKDFSRKSEEGFRYPLEEKGRSRVAPTKWPTPAHRPLQLQYFKCHF